MLCNRALCVQGSDVCLGDIATLLAHVGVACMSGGSLGGGTVHPAA